MHTLNLSTPNHFAITIIVIGLISFLLGYLFCLGITKQKETGVSLNLLFIDFLHIDKGPEEFSVELFQQLIAHIGLPSALIYYEKFFADDFSKFAFTREQLREISKTTMISENIFPKFLQLRAIDLIDKSVTSLAEAVAEYNILSPCKCTEGKDILIKMVQGRIKSITDCDYVIAHAKENEVIITTARLMKSILEKAPVAVV